MTDETRTIAGFVAGLQPEDIPPEVTARAAEFVLDAGGIAVRAHVDGDSTPALRAGLAAAGVAPGPCGLFGSAETLAPAAAAGINAALVHTLDFDDTHIGGSVHVSAPVIPAALAAAQAAGADGPRTIAAIVSGMEVMTRLGRALVPPRHYARGYHPTATTGVFGAAAAASTAMGLTAAQTEHALGIALSSAAGTLQFHANGAWTKRLQVGLAAEAGVRAACLAREGFTGASEAIEGARGLLAVFSDAPEPAAATHAFGTEWEVMRIGVKPYPACRFAHAAIDQLLALGQGREGAVVRAEDVAEIRIGLSRKALLAVAEPEARKRHARNIVDAQFSVYFLAAAALLEGGVRWDDYPALLGRADVDALADRVSAYHDEEVEALYPAAMAARVMVRLRDGTERGGLVPAPLGEPETFPDRAMLRDKATTLVAPVLGKPGAAAFCDAALGLSQGGAGRLFAAGVPASPARTPQATGV